MRTQRFALSYLGVFTDTRSKRLLILVALALILGLIVGTFARAGFVDDWITQHTETSPGYFEGQKRGYFTGGSFSARWPQTKDYLVSVEPPRLQFGCGGIDAFMGGFSFMNFEYLVQKLQRILQAAPAAAFDLALKTLCEPCSNVIKSMNAMSDALNHLQLDDCKAATVIAARAMDPFTDNAKIHAEAQKDFSLERGIQDLGQKLNDIWNAHSYGESHHRSPFGPRLLPRGQPLRPRRFRRYAARPRPPRLPHQRGLLRAQVLLPLEHTRLAGEGLPYHPHKGGTLPGAPLRAGAE